MKTNRITATLVSALLALAFVNNARATASLASASISSQSPAVASRGGLCYFPITVTRAGTGSLDVYLTVTGLPEGSEYSFVPPKVVFTAKDRSTKQATLMVRVPATTPNGSYAVTMTARHGNSPVVLTSTTTLVVGADPVMVLPPLLSTPVNQANGVLLSGTGTPSLPVAIQATTNLTSSASWETIGVLSADDAGLFSYIDQDSTNFPARFYRAMQ